MRNIYESSMWWQKVVEGRGRPEAGLYPNGKRTTFGSENGGRNIVLTLNVDGVKPYSSSPISFTPMQCMILNLPENLRHRSPWMLIPALIPGPKCANVAPYLTMLVDELKTLYSEGFQAVDPETGRSATYKVKLLSTNCDLPAHSSNNLQQPHGSTYGCMKCHLKVRAITTASMDANCRP